MEEETVFFAAKKRESVFEFEAIVGGWVRGPRLEQFLFLLEEGESFDVVVEKVGIGVLVAGEKGIREVFLERGCA